MSDEDERGTVVVDTGSGMWMAGFAGSDEPVVQFASETRRQPTGEEAESEIFRPIKRGRIEDLKEFDRLVHKSLVQELGIKPEECRVLLTESCTTPAEDREAVVQSIFDTYHPKAVCILPKPAASIFCSGRTTGVVLQAGDGVIHAVPVVEGVSIVGAIQRLELGGADLTAYMARLVAASTGDDKYTTTTAGMEIARDIKEKVAYVKVDTRIPHYITENGDIEPGSENLPSGPLGPADYECSDGTTITLDAARWQVAEALFDPRLALGDDFSGVGIHQMIYDAIMASDADHRSTLWGNIVLAGGTTKFPDIVDRLTFELHQLATATTSLKVIGMVDRGSSSFVGASILGSLDTMDRWITADEFAAEGAKIVHTKCPV